MRSDFPELEHAELKYFWEHIKKKDILALDQEEPWKLTLDELKGVLSRFNLQIGLNFDGTGRTQLAIVTSRDYSDPVAFQGYAYDR